MDLWLYILQHACYSVCLQAIYGFTSILYLRELLLDFYVSSGKRKPDQIIIFRYGVGCHIEWKSCIESVKTNVQIFLYYFSTFMQVDFQVVSLMIGCEDSSALLVSCYAAYIFLLLFFLQGWSQ